jgi:hypothetical protein
MHHTAPPRFTRHDSVHSDTNTLGVPPDTAQWIEPSTLRWHLQRVFAKTGTARQAELARLVTRVGAVTREV